MKGGEGEGEREKGGVLGFFLGFFFNIYVAFGG